MFHGFSCTENFNEIIFHPGPKYIWILCYPWGWINASMETECSHSCATSSRNLCNNPQLYKTFYFFKCCAEDAPQFSFFILFLFFFKLRMLIELLLNLLNLHPLNNFILFYHFIHLYQNAKIFFDMSQKWVKVAPSVHLGDSFRKKTTFPNLTVVFDLK